MFSKALIEHKVYKHFFDLDGTLISGNCSFSFGLFLLKKKKMSLIQAFYLLGLYTGYKSGLISLKKLHEGCFSKLVKGCLVDELNLLATEFVNTSFDRLLLKERFSLFQKAQGKKYLCSSSPAILVSLFAKKLGVDDWLATSYDADEQGFFSHIVLVVDGEQKALFLKQKVSDGEKTVAYSDSLEDEPFLKAADHFILLTPS